MKRSHDMTQESHHEWHIIRWPSGPDAEADTYPWTGPTTPEHTFEVFKQTETPHDPQEGFMISDEKTFSSENEAWAYYDEQHQESP